MPMNNRENFLDDPHMMPADLKVLSLELYSAVRAMLFWDLWAGSVWGAPFRKGCEQGGQHSAEATAWLCWNWYFSSWRCAWVIWGKMAKGTSWPVLPTRRKWWLREWVLCCANSLWLVDTKVLWLLKWDLCAGRFWVRRGLMYLCVPACLRRSASWDHLPVCMVWDEGSPSGRLCWSQRWQLFPGHDQASGCAQRRAPSSTEAPSSRTRMCNIPTGQPLSLEVRLFWVSVVIVLGSRACCSPCPTCHLSPSSQ